jgi:hypothetical protein
MKAYIQSFIQAGDEDNPRNDFAFDSHPERAMYWNSSDEAEIECFDLNRGGVTIQSLDGAFHVISNFEVEETAPGMFSICCEGPFPAQSRPPLEKIYSETGIAKQRQA